VSVSLAYSNALDSATLYASSQQSALPVAHAIDRLRSRIWASKLGYNVVAGFNDRLDFTEGGVAYAASLTAGNYATPALFAAHVQTQLNAVAPANTYTATWSTTAYKITIGRATGSATLALPFATGANVTRSAHIDLGFASTDVTGATTYTGGLVTYHSREWIVADLGAATALTFAGVVDSNLAAAGTITAQGHTSDAWTAPDYSQALTYSSPFATYAGTMASKRYWRFLIADVANPQGYSSLGVAWLGTTFTPAAAYRHGWTNGREEMSGLSESETGAGYVDLRPSRDGLAIEWGSATQADLTSFQTALDSLRVGVPFWLITASTYINETRYVALRAAISWQSYPTATGPRFSSSWDCWESLG
jgi:hypothetical protein